MSDVQSMPQQLMPTTTSTGPALAFVPLATATVTTVPKTETSIQPTPQPLLSKTPSPITTITASIATTTNNSINNNSTVTNSGQQALVIANNNQQDYFRNCNVPNLINKWRRRHTWLFLKEGKMFCQACIDFKAVAKRYGRCDERNKFCNEGSTNFRSSAVEDHARSETHLRAVRATQQQNPNVSAKESTNENGFAPQIEENNSRFVENFMNINSPSMVSRPSIMDRTRPSMAALDYAPATADVTADFAQAEKVKIEPNFTRTSSPDASVRANSSPLNAVDTTETERLAHLNCMLTKLRQQRSEGILCDVWVRYPSRQIQAHKALLSAASPVLAEKLQLESTNKSISEIEVPEVKPAIFQQIIDFIYSGEIPSSIDIQLLLEAARFLQMKDLIQRLEKFEADWNQLKNLQPDVLLSLFGNQRKRSRKPQNGHKPRMGNGPKANFMESYEYSPSPVQITDEIQIEEIVPCESSPPPPKMKKDNPIEIEVKVSDPAFPVPVKPVQVTPTGSSRRKGASQRIAPVTINDESIDGVEEWLNSSSNQMKDEQVIKIEPGT